MSNFERRRFLTRAGSSLAIATLGLRPQLAPAQSAGSNANTMLDVRTFGATGDGRTLDTPAINIAIDSVAAAGGGTLFFPAGNYLCYSIRLRSNIAFYLDAGATIVAADSPAAGATPAPGAAYDPAEPTPAEPTEDNHYQDFGHSHWHNSLIWAEGMENISITGPGRIWGKGLSRGTG